MAERDINEDAVRLVLASGKIIEEYLDDKPYASRLIIGFSGSRPIHVVAADNVIDGETYILTVYEPSIFEWDDNYSRRKRQ
jgi:hypothetical protein